MRPYYQEQNVLGILNALPPYHRTEYTFYVKQIGKRHIVLCNNAIDLFECMIGLYWIFRQLIVSVCPHRCVRWLFEWSTTHHAEVLELFIDLQQPIWKSTNHTPRASAYELILRRDDSFENVMCFRSSMWMAIIPFINLAEYHCLFQE